MIGNKIYVTKNQEFPQFSKMSPNELSLIIIFNSLYELRDFIIEAEKGLMQPLDEGEYSNLVKIMSYLVNVRDRAIDTEFMFEPLQEIVELLQSYDIEFSEETYRLMQVRKRLLGIS